MSFADGLLIGDEFADAPPADTSGIPPSGLRCATCAHTRLTCHECGGLNGFPLTALPPCTACRQRIASEPQLWGSDLLVGADPGGEILDRVIV
jgi:hypothetical protein